jgi:hypothetical protein
VEAVAPRPFACAASAQCFDHATGMISRLGHCTSPYQFAGLRHLPGCLANAKRLTLALITLHETFVVMASYP